MAIHLDILADTAFEQAIAAAKGHANDLRQYLRQRASIIARGAAAIARDRIAGAIDDDDVRFAWNEIRMSERTARLAAQVTAKAALQDAINAALAVATGALNQAIGFKLL